jgi:hypothetical protein
MLVKFKTLSKEIIEVELEEEMTIKTIKEKLSSEKLDNIDYNLIKLI